MTPDVASVKVVGDFELLVQFADGEYRRFSMKPYLEYPAYSALRDKIKFQQARVQHGTVVWSDEIDISPDTLYFAGSDVKQ